MSDLSVYLYTNTSDKRVVAKSLTNQITKSCKLKGDCSILNPVLILTGDAGDYSLVNYMYIPDFHRYYFCTVRALTGGLLEVTGEVDVLSSAWPYIANEEAVIDRQETEYNVYLNDGTFQAYAYDQVITKNFSGGFTSPGYVLVVAG